MSERLVVEFDRVGKMYRLYKSRLQSFLDITSVTTLIPWWAGGIDNFWALRNVSFKLRAGSRLGIVGRNGAGKTTLLKLMTGNIAPTEGRITVNGEVQALLEAGAGFHPEFTGYENIEASLTQNGMTRSQIRAAKDEIAEFTELGDFLGQPFKTYSAGMQARLVFTTATVVRPDILIIDEILGAGDGYFAAKSRMRMRALVESGASVLLVSHALDQILQFCDEAIWLERGRIILRGPSMEVVKAYEEFVHDLQDRQLKAANRRRKLTFREGVELTHNTDDFVLALSLEGPGGARADVKSVEFRCAGVAEEVLRVGDPQDTEQTQLSYLSLAGSDWSDPDGGDESYFRSLANQTDSTDRSVGEMVFRSYALEPGKPYSFRLHYRLSGRGKLSATASHNGQSILNDHCCPADGLGWQEYEFPVPVPTRETAEPATAGSLDGGLATEVEPGPDTTLAVPAEALNEFPASPSALHAAPEATELARELARAGDESENVSRAHMNGEIPAFRFDDMSATAANWSPVSGEPESIPAVRRWSGEGSLLVQDVTLLDGQARERAVFPAASPLSICLHYRAVKKGIFPIIYTAAIYRLDGVKVSQHVSPCETVALEKGELRGVRLEFPSMDLADGRYVISVALHRDLDPLHPEETVRYDLLDRSYEFEISGNPPLRTSLFVLPSHWVLETR